MAYTPEESLAELAELTESAGGKVIDRLVQSRPAPEAATLVGAGLVERLATQAKAERADMVIFDQELTPTQQRNLENALGAKVLDRTQLILDIFARRARTREGRLQVELAQLNYLLPRLAGRGREMSRLGGGIGTRGPGETQLETDRRRIARRIRKIREDLEAVRDARAVHRKQRQAVPLATAALVGYTNAGKSTLFNRLTSAGVLADNQMFATLDPTVRAVRLPSRRRLLLSDTVGFIRNLPTTLVESFRATLEEVTAAALILHVVDAASPHALAHIEHVSKVLAEIGASEIPQLLVLNKMDRPEHLEPSRASRPAVAISALTGEGVDELLATVDRDLPFDPVTRTSFRFPAEGGAPLDLIYRFGRVLETRYTGHGCEVEADVPESLRRKLAGWVIS
ncbi:MAG: GTPase HflX [Acidobacteria bacterium]|nr:GTPase HflX [Acidobacteriota bacterium]